MALHGTTPGKICDAVSKLAPFKIGYVSGSTSVGDYGRLPDEYVTQLREASSKGQIRYVLYSYATPMAWLVVDADGNETWVKPDVKYSVSTSGHQSTFSYAIYQRELRTAA